MQATDSEGSIACKQCGFLKPIRCFEKLPRGIRRRCFTCRGRNDRARATPPQEPLAPPKRFFRKLSGKRFLITAAQNATPVHEPFFATLKVAAAHLGAELVVIPLRYKNPTSLWTKKNERDDWWDEAVEPYLYNARRKLCRNLILAGDVKVQPTAVSPLSGFEALTGGESCILGHPKMQLKVIATSGRFPKLLTTNGVCTEKNYTDSKAGKLGEFHHYLGGLIVEIKGSTFHLRQLNADRVNGSFIDVDKFFTEFGVEPAPPAEALITGDIHVRVMDEKVDRATFGPGGMMEVLKPKRWVAHDVNDGETHNPHESKDPFVSQARYRSDRFDVRTELQETWNFIIQRAAGRQVYIVNSNHHDFLRRWMTTHDWKTDPVNAEFYLETALNMVRSAKMTEKDAEYADPFTAYMGSLKFLGVDVHCLGPDESLKVADVECGNHGHFGPNGSRGTMRNLARIGAKTFDAHGHTPGIEEGHMRVGTSTPRRLSYTHGPSSWLNTHGVIYGNGKRALINIIEGKWRA